MIRKIELEEKDGTLETKDFCKELKRLFADCKINFLLGSGFSASFLRTLGDIENLLVAYESLSEDNRVILKSYTLWLYFCKSMLPLKELEIDKIPDQLNFAQALQNLLINRHSTVLYKQVNLFTTNYDTLLELAFDSVPNIQYNDGFEGRLLPCFSTDNYSKITYRQAMFSDNVTELPTANIFKNHGSLTWNKGVDSKIIYIDYKNHILKFNQKYDSLFDSALLNDIETIISSKDTIDAKITLLEALIKGVYDIPALNKFIDDYLSYFVIVNPTKEKFGATVLNIYYHEMLRIYSNELEKQNNVLLVQGFSFRDEHLLETTKRSLINPSLNAYIFCFEKKDVDMLEETFDDTKSNNVTLIHKKNGIFTLENLNDILFNIPISGDKDGK